MADGDFADMVIDMDRVRYLEVTGPEGRLLSRRNIIPEFRLSEDGQTLIINVRSLHDAEENPLLPAGPQPLGGPGGCRQAPPGTVLGGG